MSRLSELINDLCPNGVEYKGLGDVGVFLRGSSFQKKHFVESGVPCIHYGQVHTRFGLSTREVVSYLDESFASKMKRAKTGDLIIATTSEDDEAVGKATAWLGEYDVVVSNDAFVYRHTLDSMYVSYFFDSEQFQHDKMPYLTGSKVRRISGTDMAKIRIPVPPIEVQREIVRILDSFQELDDALTAEIEAREKQRSFTIERILSRSYIEAVQGTKADELRLCEIADVGSSKRVLKRDLIDEGIPFFRGTEVAQLAEHKPINPQLYLSEELYGSISASYGVPQKGDLLLPSVNPSGLVWMVDVDYPFYLKDARVLWVHTSSADVDCRYMRYALSKSIEDNFRFIASGSQFAELKISSLSDTPILLPKKEVQSLIADKLDLVTKLAHVVVPCERDTRRKQFAHYRDKLLAFPKKEI